LQFRRVARDSNPNRQIRRLLVASPPQAAQAEAASATAIAVARRQGAKLLEDRATTSLDRLRAAQRAQIAR
jgi:hypothetical protein